MCAKTVIRDEKEVHDIATPRNIRIVTAKKSAEKRAERFGARDADVNITRMLAVSPRPRSKEEDLESRIRHHIQADSTSLVEIPFLKRRAGLWWKERL